MKTLATLVAVVLAATPLYAQQWEQTTGPEGGDVLALAANDSTLLAVMRPGIIYSYDASGWTRASTFPAVSIHASGNAFVAINHEGAFRSVDRGRQWVHMGPQGVLFRSVMNGDDLYIAADSTIYRLSDDAATWTKVASSGMLDFFSFFVHDSTILIGRGGDSVGVFRSADSGKSWRRAGAGLPPGDAPHLFHRVDSVLYCAIHFHGIYRSADWGETWSAVNEGLPRQSGEYPWIQSFLTVGDELWMAGRSGVFSRAGDSAWKTQAITSHTGIAISPERMYLGSASGVSSSADSGRSWVPINNGLRAHRVMELAPFGNAVLASAGGSIYRSTDQGGHWTRAVLVGVSRFTQGSDAMYALGDDIHNRGLFRSVDGLDWGRVGTSLPFQPQLLSALAAHKDTLYAGYSQVLWNNTPNWRTGGIYRSVDGGQSWRAANGGLPRQGTVDVPVLELFAAEGVLLAHTIDGLYRSGDGGENWSRLLLDSLSGVTPLLFAGSGDTIYLAKSARVYRSTDAGRTWIVAGGGIPAESFIHHLSIVHGVPYISMTLDRNVGRIYRLSGGAWEDISDRFPADAAFWEFVEVGDKVMAGTAWSSVWRGSLPVAGAPVMPPNDVALSIAAFPNPFASESSVEFRLKQRGEVRLVLATSLGEEIATLHAGMMEAGLRRVRLDGLDLPAGVYHLRVESNGAAGTAKVVKVK